MKTFSTIAALLVVAGGVFAQGLPSAPETVRSVSGQFTVFPPRYPNLRPPPISGKANLLTLEPTLLAVSAERIKQVVWRELGVSGQWQNRIVIKLRTARQADELVGIESERAQLGWNYRVEMPDQITSERYLRAVVQVVLLELANRSAREQCAEIPVWLTEGLTYQLLANHSAELVLNTPRLNVNGITYNPVTTDIKRVSLLEKAHKVLLGETPLTFEELSWPAPGQIDGSDGLRYRASAQLLLRELLDLRGGKDCMREFVAALPNYLNWQMAFLQGFKPHFSRPLDIEKWWALQATGFAGRDLIQTLPYEESWSRLAAALSERVDSFGNTNELPTRAEVKLQTIVREWTPAKQEYVLREKLKELESLRLRIAPELAPLAIEYSAALAGYLKQQEAPGLLGKHSPFASSQKRAQRDLLKSLDVLDARVEKLKPRPLVAGSSGPMVH